MAVIGVVSEYNPFHSGHAYLLSEARRRLGEDAPAVAVMSGNWTQQADCAVADKWVRARLALLGGADLVLELPTPWATASAERFARGGVELLHAAGIADTLVFGSECGQLDGLAAAAACLDSEDYRAALRPLLDRGLPFALCRRRAVAQLLGEDTGRLLDSPNNSLGIEYLRALRVLNSPMVPLTVQRAGQGHRESSPGDGEGGSEGPALSATTLRGLLRAGEWERAEQYLPQGGGALLRASAPSLPSLSRLESALLVLGRTMRAEGWAALPDSGAAEGLPQRLERAGRQARSLEEFFALAKTRRYTHARVRRLVLRALLGLMEPQLPAHPQYLRVLAFNGRGRALLRRMKQTALLPVLVRPAQARRLPPEARQLFGLECRCTDLYGLCFDPPRPGGWEWTHGPERL